MQVYMNHLAERVDAGVCSAGAVGRHWATIQAGQSLFQTCLHSLNAVLALKTGERAAVVF